MVVHPLPRRKFQARGNDERKGNSTASHEPVVWRISILLVINHKLRPRLFRRDHLLPVYIGLVYVKGWQKWWMAGISVLAIMMA